MGKVLYRVLYIDRWATKQIEVTFQEWTIEKETPCGYWIVPDYKMKFSKRRWIRKGSRFAYETEDEAIKAYWYRKRCHLRRLREGLERAETQMELISELLGKEVPKEPTFEIFGRIGL